MLDLKSQFTNWVKSQHPAERYDFMDTCGCAVFQFLKQAGLPVGECGGHGDWHDTDGNEHLIDLPPGALVIEPWTFGALARRLEQASGK